MDFLFFNLTCACLKFKTLTYIFTVENYKTPKKGEKLG